MPAASTSASQIRARMPFGGRGAWCWLGAATGANAGGRRSGPSAGSKRLHNPCRFVPSAAWGEMPCTHNTAPRNVSGAWSGLRGHRPRSHLCSQVKIVPSPSPSHARILPNEGLTCFCFVFHLPVSPSPPPTFELCSGDWQSSRSPPRSPTSSPPLLLVLCGLSRRRGWWLSAASSKWFWNAAMCAPRSSLVGCRRSRYAARASLRTFGRPTASSGRMEA